VKGPPLTQCKSVVSQRAGQRSPYSGNVQLCQNLAIQMDHEVTIKKLKNHLKSLILLVFNNALKAVYSNI
jgi:hypothetical protein